MDPLHGAGKFPPFPLFKTISATNFHFRYLPVVTATLLFPTITAISAIYHYFLTLSNTFHHIVWKMAALPNPERNYPRFVHSSDSLNFTARYAIERNKIVKISCLLHNFKRTQKMWNRKSWDKKIIVWVSAVNESDNSLPIFIAISFIYRMTNRKASCGKIT